VLEELAKYEGDNIMGQVYTFSKIYIYIYIYISQGGRENEIGREIL
jgi:hypothetical protein